MQNKISIPNKEKFEWFNSLKFQDVIDNVLKDTIISYVMAEKGMEWEISTAYCSDKVHYRRFNEIKYRNVRLEDLTVIDPETLMKDIKFKRFNWELPTLSKKMIKGCGNKKDICKLFFKIIKRYLYFQIRDYDYIRVEKIISTDENAFSKDKEKDLKKLGSDIFYWERKFEETLRSLKNRYNKLERYNNIHNSINLNIK